LIRKKNELTTAEETLEDHIKTLKFLKDTQAGLTAEVEA
jgi:hypothetical protein